MGERLKLTVETEDKKACIVPSSGHERAIAILNSQKPWLPTLGLHNYSLVNDQFIAVDHIRPHPSLLNLCLLKVC